MTILLVDSDKSALDRETKRLTQQTLAITVSLHSSGDDALQFSISHDVDMVFTRDILADMTGSRNVGRVVDKLTREKMLALKGSYRRPPEVAP